MSATAAADAVAIVRESFEAYREGFRAFTLLARAHFEAGAWLAAQRDSAERLDYQAPADSFERGLAERNRPARRDDGLKLVLEQRARCR